MIAMAMVLVAAAACGGDSDDETGGDSGGDGNTGNTRAEEDSLGFDPGFGVGDLPAGFPSELIPPSFSSGRILDIGEQEVVALRSEMTFDEALEHYTAVLGEGLVIEAGDRQAQWLNGPGWAVALFGEDPLEITMTRLPD